MSKEFIPSICGDDNIHIPDAGCDDCEKLELRVYTLEGKVETLEECCEEVKEELDKKLEQHDIIAGDNVSISYEEDGTVIINSAGGGGGGITKTDILTAMGYNEIILAMTDYENVHHSWRVMGVRVDGDAPTPPTPTPTTVTKQQILDAMGYTEFEIEMTDENDEVGTWRIIGEQIG